VGQGLLTVEAARSHSVSDQPDALDPSSLPKDIGKIAYCDDPTEVRSSHRKLSLGLKEEHVPIRKYFLWKKQGTNTNNAVMDSSGVPRKFFRGGGGR
jgi:hypothetical protein